MSQGGSARGPTTRKECLDKYLGEIRAAEASGDYSRYEQLAADYTQCLAQVDSGIQGWGDQVTTSYYGTPQAGTAPRQPQSSAARRNAEAAHQAAVENAIRTGDMNAVRNLNNAYQAATLNAR